MPTNPSRRSSRPPASEQPARLLVRVQPRSARNRILLEPDGRVRIHVTAPPVEGEANAAVCTLLADTLHVAKSTVRVVQGARSRDKHISIEGLSLESVLQRLNAACE
jgi:uncharacterized protein (TIGR00251 family)